MVEPLRPQDIQHKTLPDGVIEVFNDLIQENYFQGKAVVLQETAVQRISRRLGLSGREIFDNHLLDVEDVYETAGWKVVYDKPAYNESYPATFTFTRPPQGR